MAAFNQSVNEPHEEREAIVVDPIVIPGLPELQRFREHPGGEEALKLWFARNPNSQFHTRADVAKSPDVDKIFPPSKAETWKRPSPPFDKGMYADYMLARQQLRTIS